MDYKLALKHWAAWLLSDRILNKEIKAMGEYLARMPDGISIVTLMQDYFIFRKGISKVRMNIKQAKSVEHLIINNFNSCERKILMLSAVYGESIGYKELAVYLDIPSRQMEIERLTLFNKFKGIFDAL